MRHAALGTCKSPRSDDSWPLLLCQLHEATADQSERLQEEGGLSIVIGANMVTMTSPLHLWDSMSINELNLGDLFVFEQTLFVIGLGRSNLFVQQKPLRPRKFKNCNSSWQRPAQTIQIRADKNMSADFCHELLLEEMQSRAWELHWELHFMMSGKNFGVKCSPAKHRELEAERPASTDEGTREKLQQLHCSRGRGGTDDEWCLAHVSIASIACNFVEYF